MAKQKTTYTACNGREFDTMEEAQQYEIMKHADEEFHKAVNVYNLTLAKALKTADGYPFEFGREYYIVWEHAYTYGISREYLYARHTKVEWDGSRAPVILFNRVQDNERKYVEFQLSNIYTKERNAKLELLAIHRKRLEWLEGDIAKLEKELGIESKAAAPA